MTIAIIGATGLVGQTMLKVLEERNLPFTNLLVAASDQSKGNTVAYNGVTLTLVSVQSALTAKPDIALSRSALSFLNFGLLNLPV